MPQPSKRLDPDAVDHVLTTTRSVRRRLDLDRPVDRQVILDCIDVAEQAPSGGNVASRRWIVIVDANRKREVAELYRRAAGDFIVGQRDRLAGTGHPMERTMESAAYLVEHLADVPAIVIPTIWGRHDGSGRPGLFDSVVQAAWSFCLAARARGLGTAWTTAVFRDEDEVKTLLGIPAGTTEIVMLPLAHTVGTDFSPVRRRSATEITYFDTYGHTADGGVVEIDVQTRPRRLRELLDARRTNGTLGGAGDGAHGWHVELEPVGAATRMRLSVRIGTDETPETGGRTVGEQLRAMQSAAAAIMADVEADR
jgi:nitroreductase